MKINIEQDGEVLWTETVLEVPEPVKLAPPKSILRSPAFVAAKLEAGARYKRLQDAAWEVFRERCAPARADYEEALAYARSVYERDIAEAEAQYSTPL